jgi:hypothetical protein
MTAALTPHIVPADGAKDPLAVALVTAVEEVLTQGVLVEPRGEGWLVRLAPGSAAAAGDKEPEPMRRSW